jgi:pimeloyl-[acyl-carrier protein] methyl ester esterase
MDQPTFQSFKSSFKNNAIDTLKKFGFMVCQGTENTKQDFLTLQSLIQPQNLDVLNAGLNCLEQLNNVNILEQYQGFQLHLFSKQDYLVSYKVSRNIQKLSAKFLEVDLISGSHGFPLFNHEAVISKLSQYLSKID